jgi:hypothetical protein
MTLMLTLALTSVSSQKVIESTLDDQGNLKLGGDISADGTTIKGNFFNRKVIWENDTTKITKFEIVGKKGTQINPFTSRSYRRRNHNKSRIKLRVKLFLHSTEWLYCIEWTARDNKSHLYDPKIAVRPKRF